MFESFLINLQAWNVIKKNPVITAQETKINIKDVFSKCDQIRKETVDLVTFTDKIFNGKLHFCPLQLSCNTIFWLVLKSERWPQMG